MSYFYKNFDNLVKKYGYSEGCKRLILNLGLRVKVRLKDFPKNGSVLIYANHPTGIDPFLLSSALERDDVVFLGDKYHMSKGKNIAKHVSPTVSDNFWKSFLKRRFTNWPGYIYMRIKYPPLSKPAARKVNLMALKKIVSNLSKGHVSIVFPSGGEYEFLPWKKGIYKIISMANEKGIKYTLYKVQLKDISELRLMLHFLFGKRVFSGVEIYGKKVLELTK